MIAAEMTTDLIPPLKVTDSGSKALSWMNEMHISHLPVVKADKYVGLISEDEILDMENPELSLEEVQMKLSRPLVNSDQHIYDVIRTATQSQLSVVPVVDSDDTYQGVITQEEMIKYFSLVSSLEEPGGIIVLEIAVKDYVMSEISRIVESNDARILSMHTSTHGDSAKMELTMKLNVTELKHIAATFERYNYTVKASFQEFDQILEDLKHNYDALMKYLNI